MCAGGECADGVGGGKGGGEVGGEGDGTGTVSWVAAARALAAWAAAA